MDAVAPAIVVEIVLTIMLLRINAMTFHFLGMMQMGTLLTGHNAVSPGLRLDISDALLALIQARRLSLGQAARCDTLLDACFLIDLALIDARGVCLGHGQHGQAQAKNCNDLDAFHNYLLFAGRIP
jgi:hypothetical protein